MIDARRQPLTAPVEARECERRMVVLPKLIVSLGIRADLRAAVEVLADEGPVGTWLPPHPKAREAGSPCAATRNRRRARVGVVVVAQGSYLESVVVPPGKSAVVARLAIDLVIERLRGMPEPAEWGRGAGGQRGPSVGDQGAGGNVPSVGGGDNRKVAEVITARTQPPRLHFGADRTEFFADPGVEGGRCDRVHVAPARAAVLERYRHKERADTGAPAQRVRGKRPNLRPELANVHGIAVVIAVSIDDGVKCHDVRQTQA